MLGSYGLDDEEALLDALAKRRLADARGIPDGTVGPTPESMEFPEMDLTADDPVAKLPALTPMPARIDLTAARAADAQQGMARGFETAARQAIGGLTLTRPADTITPEGDAEKTALADEARTRADVLEQRKAQMLDRQKALAALLRPEPKAKSPEEIEAARIRAEAAKSNAETYRQRTTNDAEIARERLAAQKAAQAARAGAAKAKADTKAGAPVQGLAAGYELTGETKPVTAELTKHQSLVASAEKMKGLTAQMRKALEGASTLDRLNPLGEKRNAIKQLATMIAIEGKNIAELGALSGPDYALMNTIAADPTSVASLTKDLPSLLTQLDAWGANSVAAKSKALGVRPKQQSGERTIIRTGVNQKTGKRVVQYSDGTTEEQ